MTIEDNLKAALGVSEVKKTNISGGGCINSGCAYKTNDGLVFVKQNSDNAKAKVMFKGEFEGLKAIMDTNTVKVPKPLAIIEDGAGSSALVMEYLDMSSLSRCDAALGEKLAMLHLHNKRVIPKNSESIHKSLNEDADDSTSNIEVDEFGFHETTCCGHIPLDNTWKSDWIEFFAQQRIETQVRMIEEKTHDREVRELWSSLQRKLPSFFENISIWPALLHGDLWSGNAAEADGAPVIFDPASFYGHSEFDLAIAKMFGGFSHSFFASYHKIIPKDPGFETRLDLYQVFHYMNHWNHFGGGYRSSTISLMKRLSRI